VTQFEKPITDKSKKEPVFHQESSLRHWPVQLRLVPPTAPFLKNADLLLVADCVPFAYADFHPALLSDHALLVACPKLDDFDAHLARLTEIFRQTEIKSLTIVKMEVPCCSGLVHLAKQAIAASGKNIPFTEITIDTKGNRI
jgi:hypothetical protein